MYCAVGDGGEVFVVGDDDERLSELVAQVEEELVKLGLVLGVERAGRLVGEHHRRTVHQGARHGHTLLLAAGEFGRLVRRAVGEAHKLKQFHGAAARLLRRLAADVGRNHDVLKSRELREELVKLKHEADVAVAEVAELLRVQTAHVNAVDDNGAAVGPVERAHDLKQRGLAGTARTDNAHDLALADVQVDAFEDLQRAEALGDIVNVYHCC